MILIKKLLTYFNGLHYPQEYLCLRKGACTDGLHLYIVTGNKIVADITEMHLFAGYSPLIFVLSQSLSINHIPTERIELIFSNSLFRKNELFSPSVAIAGLSMKKIRQETVGETGLFFYEGVTGWHRFIPNYRQWILGLHNRWYNQQAGNVFLEDNLFTQVQVAYAVPRKVSLITVSDGMAFNLFPTDLHGMVDENIYVVSLRHEGKAYGQVKEAGKILLSDMDARGYQSIYKLGKNHMQPMKTRESFDFGDAVSAEFQLPLPKNAVGYRELQLYNFFHYGIHALLIFKITHQVKGPEADTLMHIHNAYATWRYKNSLSSNYLLR